MKQKFNIRGILISWFKGLLAWKRYSVFLLMLMVFSSINSYSGERAAPAENIDLQATISGQVLDEAGSPLPGVSVIIQGTTQGVATDFDGKYTITASESDVLEFSFLGFVTQSVVVGNQQTINIVLVEDAAKLEEVVLVGYGAVKKEDLTGAVGSVGGDDLESRGSVDAVEALQGQIAGVNITRSSGRSDVGFDVVIRGQNSIAGGSPLYVVDGLVVDNIDFLNPNDIKQMDILKDASSTAIYGSRGSNGVVLVTTKGADAGTDRVSISYDGYYGVKTPAHLAPMMNDEQWLNYRIAAAQGNNTEPFSGAVFGATNEVVRVSGDEWDREIQRRIDAGETYNWPEKYMKDGSRQNHYLSMNGKSGKTSFSLTAGYQNEKGFIEKDFLNKYSFSLDLKHKFNDKWEVGGQFRTGFVETEVAGGKSILNYYRMPPVALSSDPTGWLYEDEGLTIRPARWATGAINPLLDQKYSNTNNRYIDVLGKIYLDFTPLEWLNVRTEFMPRSRWSREGTWDGINSSQAGGTQSKTAATASNSNRLEFTWDNIVNASKTYGKHTIQGTGLFSIYNFEEENYFSEVMDLTQNTSFYNMDAANVRSITSSSYAMSRLVSFMARFNYDFDQRFLFTVSARWDGSSKLSEGNKWASFPSAAVAWKMSEESWLKDSKTVSNLKLRLSYGFTGNNNIPPYLTSVNANYLYSYDFNGSLANGIGPSGLANSALTWERTGELNFGVDYGFLNNRISGSLDLYSRKSEDLLLDRRLPVPMGWEVVIDNIGSVKNEGLEASLRTVNIQNNDWFWETSFIFSTNKNSVVETYLGKVDDVVNGLFIGQPIDVHYNYDFIGIWQLDERDEAAAWGREPGMPKIRDISGPDGVPDGRIDAQYDRTIIGKPIPDWTGSFSTRLTFKNIDFALSIYTEQGVMKRSNFYNDLIYTSRNTVVHNYWTVTNPSNEAPSPAFLGDQFWGRKGARLQNYHDTSYTRVQNITLGYTFPYDIVEKLNLNRFRIYANATNPFLWTSFDGHDPEFGDKGANFGPSFMTIQFGVNINF